MSFHTLRGSIKKLVKVCKEMQNVFGIQKVIWERFLKGKCQFKTVNGEQVLCYCARTGQFFVDTI